MPRDLCFSIWTSTKRPAEKRWKPWHLRKCARPHPIAVNGEVALVDRWIFSRLARATAQVNDALEHFRFHEAAHVVYHFFWGDFCDWYIEWVKPELNSADRAKAQATWKNLFAAFESALRLLHPFMPFLTEELWHQLPQRAGARSIALDRFPEPQRNESTQPPKSRLPCCRKSSRRRATFERK